MVKRQPVRAYIYALFALMVMMMCWEANKASAALLDPVIPKESIRLRILANSDTPEDQQMKRIVRDAVVAQMNGWVTGPATIEQARQVVREHLPELGTLVERKLQEYGYGYGEMAELGIVPFPTKMYGDRVYPAGNYEALRITLGKGEGQNWWCVLFPPLCFVDAAAGEAVAKVKVESGDHSTHSTTTTVSSNRDHTSVQAKSTAGKVTEVASNGKADHEAMSETKRPEVKFFLWEKIKQFVSWLKNLFA